MLAPLYTIYGYGLTPPIHHSMIIMFYHSISTCELIDGEWRYTVPQAVNAHRVHRVVRSAMLMLSASRQASEASWLHSYRDFETTAADPLQSGSTSGPTMVSPTVIMSYSGLT
jgi:hypothetical protein